MKIISRRKLLVLAILIVGIIISCNEKVESKVNIIYHSIKEKVGIIAKIGDVEITEQEFYKGIQSDIYEAEMKIFNLKQNRLKALALKAYMENDPRKKGLSNDKFLEKYISKNSTPSTKEINDFIKKRKIPKEHVNDKLKERISNFLKVENKKKEVERWLAKMSKKKPINAYFKKPEMPTFNVTIGNAPFYGNKNAKVTIVEFSDFQCPFCSKGHELLNELKKKYGNKIRIHFKNFPLSFHNHAQKAAEAGLCAYDQGVDKFWKMHDWMFTNQKKLAVKDLKDGAKKIGLKMDKFSKCLDSSLKAKDVKKDLDDGLKAGVKSTPSFFVNGKLIQGAQSIEVFSELIDSEMK